MTEPQKVIEQIFKALKADGTLFVADLNVLDSFEDNLRDNPLAKYFYACSISCCLPSSLSQPGGAGLGTLGFGEKVARDMAKRAGFTQFKRHDFQNPFNAYYEIRP